MKQPNNRQRLEEQANDVRDSTTLGPCKKMAHLWEIALRVNFLKLQQQHNLFFNGMPRTLEASQKIHGLEDTYKSTVGWASHFSILCDQEKVAAAASQRAEV